MLQPDWKVGILRLVIRALHVLFFVLVIFFVSAGIAGRVKSSNLDSANFLSFIDKSNLFSPLNSDYAATNDGAKDIVRAKAEKVCEVIEQANHTPRQFFKQKPFVFASFISASGWLLPVSTNWLAGLWLATSLVGGLFALYIFMQKLGLPTIATLLVLTTICIFPVLTNSFLGQIYMDLLMFGPATTLVLIVWWMKNRSLSLWRWAIILTFALGTVSERGAFLSALIGFGYTLLLFGRNVMRQRQVFLLALSGLTTGVWGFVWTKYIMVNRDYAGRSYRDSLSRLFELWDLPLRPLLIVFIFTSIMFLLLAAFSGRTFLITLCSLSPNLLMSVGGAELTGFYTHYHQTYLGVLVSTATIGIIHISSKLSTLEKIFRERIIISLAMLLPVVSVINWSIFSERTFAQLRFDTRQVFIHPQLNGVSNDREEKLDQLTSFLKTLKPEIISGGESIMPALFLAGFNDVEYWPVGVGVADVVVAPLIDGLPRVYPFGDIWGNGDELQKCTMELLNTEYELVQKFEDYAIYKKI